MSYGYYPYPPPPPAKPPISGADLAISIVALVLTVVGGVVAAFMAVMMMAFTDYCPPATCDVETGITLVMMAFGAAAVIGVAGAALTIMRLVRRQRAWPFAVGTLVLCGIACLLGMAGYITAVS